MKKILFFLIVSLCCGCNPIYTITSIGSVTAYTSNGDILRKWEHVTLTEKNTYGDIKDNAFKSFGYNFYDASTDKCVVISNAVPCIVEYNIIKDETTNNTIEEISKETLEQYYYLHYQAKDIKKTLRKIDKNSAEYINTMQNLNELNEQKRNLKNILWDKYGISVL